MNISILNRSPQHAAERLAAAPVPGPHAEARIAAQVRGQVWQRMARECGAMVQHALSTGRVPAEVVERLDRAISASDGLAVVVAPDRYEEGASADAAVRSASAAERSRFASLALAHAGSARAIAPATPRRCC